MDALRAALGAVHGPAAGGGMDLDAALRWGDRVGGMASGPPR